MTIATRPREYTVEEAQALPDAEIYELVDGCLKERDMGWISSIVEAWTMGILMAYARDSGIFWPLSPAVGIHLFPERRRHFRRPDLALVRRSRFEDERLADGDLYLVPDFIAEVVSANDLAREVDTKVDEYMTAGVPMAWFIYPDSKTVMVFRPGEPSLRLGAEEALPGFDVLPGFDHKVGELFPF